MHTDFISTDKFEGAGGVGDRKEETGLVGARRESAAAEMIQLQTVSVITVVTLLLGPNLAVRLEAHYRPQ